MIDQNSPELLAFIAGVNKVKEAYRLRNGFDSVYASLTVEVGAVGPKFVKLQNVETYCTERNGVGHVQKSGVYAFIDRKTGDVFKAATFSAPAKGARGNLFAADGGLGRCTPHGLEHNS